MSNFDDKNFNLQAKAQNESRVKDNLENATENKNKDYADIINKIAGNFISLQTNFEYMI